MKPYIDIVDDIKATSMTKFNGLLEKNDLFRIKERAMAKRSLQTTQKDVANCDHLPQLSVESRILTIRDVQVILDRDLAELYGVQTARLNEQVKRNARRFPEAFRFQLNQQETDELIANCDRFKTLKHSSFCPYAFTEQGVAMLSAVLHSDTAVQLSF